MANQGTGKEGDSGTSSCRFLEASSKEEDSRKGEVKVKLILGKGIGGCVYFALVCS